MASVNQPLGVRGIFIPAYEWDFIPGPTWTETRGAAGNYFHRKTGAAETARVALNLQKAIRRTLSGVAGAPLVNAPLGGELQEGGLFTGFNLVYAIGTAGLTSLAVATYETAYANNTAPAVTSPGGAVITFPTSGATIPIATQAQPYVAQFANTTPYLIGQNFANVSDWLELVIVDPGTAVFDLYGVLLKMNANS